MSGTFTPPLRPGIRYRVYMTPRTANMVYGAEVEVTNFITDTGINVIQRGIDSQDFEIGVYFYSDIQVVAFNVNGKFNENDSRSIFPYLRDLTKVRVVYENSTGDTIVFYGLINDSATTIDALSDNITFAVLSRDSVIRSTQVAGGIISDGMSCKNAIFAILNQSAISSVLSISLVNINPFLNFTIDVGSAFDGQPTQDSLNILLLASNSVMTIDSSGVVTIKARSATTSTPILNLYGPFDIKRRQNIITVSNYNNGLQRMFTSIYITDASGNDTTKDNVPLANIYGFNQKEIDLPFLSSASTISSVLSAILAEFCVPKVELMVEVPSSVAHGVDLLDRVSIDWPLRVWPNPGQFMPVIGTATIGNTNLPLPNKSGSIVIDPNMAFKVIEIDEDPTTFTTTLKLRQIGNTLSDGWFSSPQSAVIGFAIVGVSLIGGTGDPNEKWNPSVLGAAVVGSTSL